MFYFRFRRAVSVLVLCAGAIFAPGLLARAQVGPYEDTSGAVIDAAIVCPAGASVTITVPDAFIIDDLNVGFMSAHAWRNDINLWIISPTGTRVDLLTGPYGTQFANYNVVFDDSATELPDLGAHASSDVLTDPPLDVQSEGTPLSGFNGEQAQGDWTIGYCDIYSASMDGTLDLVSLQFTVMPAAVLSGSKTNAIFDPGATGLYALPSNDVLYTITVTNTGDGPVDVDGIFLVDAVPSEIEFFNADIDTGGPDVFIGFDPVGFSQSSGAGLSWAYPGAVGYSNLGIPPTNMGECSYTPVSGYDPTVRFICFAPSGQLVAADPDPTFSVSFRARIR